MDIGAITLLMHASGGVDGGLGLLLVVTVAGGSLLLGGRRAILFAAVATLAILGEQLVNYLQGAHLTNFTFAQTGLLGATLFAVALLSHALATRIRSSEVLAETRAAELADLSRLNELIIQRMGTGILVVDSSGNVRHANAAASKLLGLEGKPTGNQIDNVSHQLGLILNAWKRGDDLRTGSFHPDRSYNDLFPRIVPLGVNRSEGALVFLDDAALMTEEAQQIKLASLGRLTASIAHEVRNPLSAIQHASQLLGEAINNNSDSEKLTAIIQKQTRRINQLIENVLQLSRKQQYKPRHIVLDTYLHEFYKEFSQMVGAEKSVPQIEVDPADMQVLMDPSHLNQVLCVLCQNSLHHGLQDGQTTRIKLTAGTEPETGSRFLEVSDNGPGITEDAAARLFEPFLTTSASGIGLGLYIARELCALNRARLYLKPSSNGACFRIEFTSP